MSSSISIFVKAEHSYKEFITCIEDLLGVGFKTIENARSLSRFEGLGLQINLIGELDYMDEEPNLIFSEYSYEIRVEISIRVEEYTHWKRLEYYMAMYIYDRMREDFGWKCMVLEDLEDLLARN
jgi:hypothetical protein